MNTLVPPKDLGYTDIYLDFIEGNDPANGFYIAKDLAPVADEIDQKEYDRSSIAAVLKRQNQEFGATKETLANIEKIEDPRAVCVFAGQQAVLFGGALLVTIKALSVLKAAETYAKELDRPVIPIFWIAGDDHDFEEVNHTFVLNREGKPERIAYESPPEEELPTSQITFSDKKALDEAIVKLKDTLGDSDFTPELYEAIDKAYTTDDTFVSAFGKLMTSLLGRFGLVLFNPGDSEAKKLAVPFFKNIVTQQDKIHDEVSRTNEQLRDSGYHIQVEKADNATHLFCNDGGRRPIHRDGDSFVCEGKKWSKDELLTMIDEHPERFSPDVITRPVLQSYLFPVLSQKGGPSEIAYLAQINPVFSLFDVVTPAHKARPTATFVEKRFEKQMKEHKISFEAITGDIEQVINRVMSESFPDDLEENFERMRKDIEERFEEFSEKSLHFDRGLENFAKQTFGKIDYALRNFEGKVFSSHKKKSNTERERIYRLGNALYPDRTLQERKLNASYFISKYSMNFLKFAYDKLDSEEKSHQLIYLSEMPR